MCTSGHLKNGCSLIFHMCLFPSGEEDSDGDDDDDDMDLWRDVREK